MSIDLVAEIFFTRLLPVLLTVVLTFRFVRGLASGGVK